MQSLKAFAWKYELPTWAVAIAIYGLWAAMVWFHASIPWWAMIPMGGYLLAWHFSLQHEAIHSFRSVPDWLRFTLVYPPIGLWFPYPLYNRSHSRHHRNTHLTDPGEDTESNYVRREDWDKLGPVWHAILIANQTLAGRLLLGPFLRLRKMVLREAGKIAAGNFADLPIWGWHVAAVAVLFWYISGVCGMPWWQYLLLVAYPGMSLGMLRAFTEHHYAARPGARTASVESGPLFSLLFLNNNLHILHHLKPTMPWFEIPSVYSRERARLLEHNEHFVFSGYREIARRWLFRPVFHPIHPVK